MVAFSGLATTLKSSKLEIANYLHRSSIALTIAKCDFMAKLA
ncbi:hypothetical protein [Microcoleus sp. BROC3]